MAAINRPAESSPMSAEDVLALYDSHARELIGFFVRRTRDPQLALDLLSETFLTAFEHRGQCRARSGRESTAWLYRIAVNKLAAHRRRGAIERRATERFASELRSLTESEVAAFDRLAHGEESGGLSAALAALSDEQRRAVRARVVEEHSYEAVARELGVSQPAARARVSRGLRALRRAVAGNPAGGGDGPS